MSEESIRPPATSDSSLASKLTFIHNIKIALKFEGICFRQIITTFRHRIIVDLCIVNESDTWSRDLNNDFTLDGGLCEAIKLNKMLTLINMDMVVMVLDFVLGHNCR